MIYATLLIRIDTGEVVGSITSTTKGQVIPQFKHPVVALRVARTHPAIQEHCAWTAHKREIIGTLWDRQLARKPQEQIDAEIAERRAHFAPSSHRPKDTDVLLALVNELRMKNGDPPVTLESLRSVNDQTTAVVLPRSPV